MTPEDLAGLPEVARLMVRLCEIPSPSREEGRVAELVRSELRSLGADVHEDGAAATLPAGCGNIVGRFAPTAEGGVPIMFGPIFIFGIAIGALYRLSARLIWHHELFVAYATVTFWLSVYLFERSWDRIIGVTMTQWLVMLAVGWGLEAATGKR